MLSNMVVPDQSRSEQRALLSGTYLSPVAPGHAEGEWGLWGLTCCLCILSDVHGQCTPSILGALNASLFLMHPE